MLTVQDLHTYKTRCEKMVLSRLLVWAFLQGSLTDGIVPIISRTLDCQEVILILIEECSRA